MVNDKIEEMLQLSKLTNYLNEKKKDETLTRRVKIALICIGALAIIAAGGYVVYRILNRYDDEYDLYDDLDNYYEEDKDEEEEDDEGEE